MRMRAGAAGALYFSGGDGEAPMVGLHNATPRPPQTLTHIHTHHSSLCGLPCVAHSCTRPTITGVTCRSATWLYCTCSLLCTNAHILTHEDNCWCFQQHAAYLAHRSSPALSSEHLRLSATTSPSPRKNALRWDRLMRPAVIISYPSLSEEHRE